MKINQNLAIILKDDEQTLELSAPLKLATMQKFEAIKLRNFLNDFINGNLESLEEFDFDAKNKKQKREMLTLKGLKK